MFLFQLTQEEFSIYLFLKGNKPGYAEYALLYFFETDFYIFFETETVKCLKMIMLVLRLITQ